MPTWTSYHVWIKSKEKQVKASACFEVVARCQCQPVPESLREFAGRMLAEIRAKLSLRKT